MLLKYGNLMLPAAPFYENYAKLYFDAKQLKMGMNKDGGVGGGGGGWAAGCKLLVPFFQKSVKVSILANIEHCPKFLQYALIRGIIR